MRLGLRYGHDGSYGGDISSVGQYIVGQESTLGRAHFTRNRHEPSLFEVALVDHLSDHEAFRFNFVRIYETEASCHCRIDQVIIAKHILFDEIPAEPLF